MHFFSSRLVPTVKLRQVDQNSEISAEATLQRRKVLEIETPKAAQSYAVVHHFKIQAVEGTSCKQGPTASGKLNSSPAVVHVK